MSIFFLWAIRAFWKIVVDVLQTSWVEKPRAFFSRGLFELEPDVQPTIYAYQGRPFHFLTHEHPKYPPRSM